MQSIVEINNALCRIGRKRLLEIEQFAIEPGQHWCLFGPNGAGKSLLSQLLLGKKIESRNYVRYGQGFDPLSDSFIVSFEEQQRLWQRDNRLDISEYSANAQDQGTLVEQLIRSSRPAQLQDQALLEDLVQRLGLGGLLNKGIRFLSSGQVRKALIARALYAETDSGIKLIVLDDPLESIDRDSQQRISSCIKDYLGQGFASLQLCRRHTDMLPGVTHLALMQDLVMGQRGPLEDVLQGPEFAALSQQRPQLPERLPASALAGKRDRKDSTLIELVHVDVNCGEQRVLSDVNWSMGPDRHSLIEGPNGCGKSTLLSLIDGDNHKGYGQHVSLFGRRKGSGETVWEIKARFGIVSNELHNKYVKGWKVLDVVVSGFFDSVGLYDDSGSREQGLARQWLQAMGIAALEKSYYHEISFGQQRLVLLARAMVKQPQILVLDEPCVGLDDYHRLLILGMLELIARQTSTNIIYVSHVEGEQPHCINQRLSLVPHAEGGYTLAVSEL